VENVAELWPTASSPAVPHYTFETVLVTPEMADTWLVGMRVQRRLRKGNLAKLVRIIETGKWLLMPHGLVFSGAGRLLDGQHRLRAIVDTGKAQWLVLARGCPAEYYGMIGDAVAPKNGEDVLKAAGCAGYVSYVGNAVRMTWRASLGYSPFNEAQQPTNEELVETYLAHRERIDEGAMLAGRVRELCSSPGTLAYVLALALGTDAEETRRFVEGVQTGINLPEGDPALFLRNVWTDHRVKGIVRHRSDLATEAAVALNHHLRGRKLRSWRGIDFGTGKMPPVGR
jgi:hypothetical protein